MIDFVIAKTDYGIRTPSIQNWLKASRRSAAQATDLEVAPFQAVDETIGRDTASSNMPLLLLQTKHSILESDSPSHPIWRGRCTLVYTITPCEYLPWIPDRSQRGDDTIDHSLLGWAEGPFRLWPDICRVTWTDVCYSGRLNDTCLAALHWKSDWDDLSRHSGGTVPQEGIG